MKYLLVIEYAYYTTKLFFSDVIEFTCDKNPLKKKSMLIMLKKLGKDINNL